LPFMTAGFGVFGFLPGYAMQEGFAASGEGFYLVGLLHHVPFFAALDAPLYGLGAGVILIGLGVTIALTRHPAQPPFAAAALLATFFIVLLSPHYPWYFAWLILFACFVRSFAILWLTNACLLLYLSEGYVFVRDDHRLALETVIYAPFAALALADLWYHRR